MFTPSSPQAGYSQIAVGTGPGQWNQVTGALLVDASVTVNAKTLVGGPSLVTVDNTTNGKTLATLLGVALSTSLKTLTLIPASAGIYWAAGNASAASAPLPAGGIGIDIGKTAADTLKFFAATSIAMTIVQEG